jgi:N-acetylglucosaminyldiphosphoundecaprenol N-acetyl-beta-D-mannosaminyltransferase
MSLPPFNSRPPIAILGVRFDNVTITETLEIIERMIATRQPHYAVTANVDFVVQAQTDVELRRIFFDAHLVLCDGTPLVWASRLLGNPLCERVAGADIVPLLIQLAETKGYRVFFLGAAPESIERAVANVRARHPGLTICGHYSPPFNQLLEMNHDEIRRRVLEAQPDLLFVSLGCPKQEKWVAMNYRALGVPVTIGVGATIDFLAGQVRRAPLWMQRSGLEWVFRLLQEPRRLYRRYSKDIRVFGVRLLGQLWHLLNSRRSARGNVGTEEGLAEVHDAGISKSAAGEDACTLEIRHAPPVLEVEGIRKSLPPFNKLAAGGDNCLLDLSQVEFIDSTGVAALMKLNREVAMKDRHLILVAPTPAVTRFLAFMRLEGFFVSAESFAAARSILRARAREREAKVCVAVSDTFRALVWYGEITAVNVDQVWERTRSYLEEAGKVLHGSSQPGSITIDLSVVTFIDSSGLGLMVRARRFAAQSGLKVRFANPQSAVLNVVQIARLEEFLLDHKRGRFPFFSHVRRLSPTHRTEKEASGVLAAK